MTLHEKHMHRIALVNSSVTEEEHEMRRIELSAWRDGVRDAGRSLNYIRADLEDDTNRPMVAGVWIDWKPKEAPESGGLPEDFDGVVPRG